MPRPLARHHWSSNASVLLIAILGCGTAALAPTFSDAARVSVERDAFAEATVTQAGFQVVHEGQVRGALDEMTAAVRTAISSDRGPTGHDVFAPAVLSLNSDGFFSERKQSLPIVWRSGVCAHLTVTAGTCEVGQSEVLVSESLATLDGLRVGASIPIRGIAALTVVGIYRVPADVTSRYWFLHGPSYFPVELQPSPLPREDHPVYDALFTTRATIEQSGEHPQAKANFEQYVDESQLTTGDLGRLAAAEHGLSTATGFPDMQAAAHSSLSATIARVRDSWRSLSQPILLITAQTVLLIWLLLFIAVANAVESRRRDVELGTLRGFSSRQLLRVGISGPLLVLLLAWPLGAVVAWLAGQAVGHTLLRPGTPVTLSGVTWLIAGIGIAGGLVACAAAARRQLRTTAVQSGSTDVRPQKRDWVIDAVVVTFASAALFQLWSRPDAPGSPQTPLALAAPALLGIAVAVVASRLLPLLCRAAFGVTSRRGSLAGFLAVRHVARQPGGVRMTMVLASAMAITTFGIASWVVGEGNRATVAGITNGAPVVFDVDGLMGNALDALVAAEDPAGTSAVAVTESYDPVAGTTLLAVDARRFAGVAAGWTASTRDSSAAHAAALTPPVSAPVVIAGDAMQVHVRVRTLSSPVGLGAEVRSGSSRQYVDLGVISARGDYVSGHAALADCPCELSGFTLSSLTGADSGLPVTMELALTGITSWTGTNSQQLPGELFDPARWTTDVGGLVGQATGAAGAVAWPSTVPPRAVATLLVHDTPHPLPALVAVRSTPGVAGVASGPFSVTGLDGRPLTVAPVATDLSLPGAPNGGVVVDHVYAERAATGDTTRVRRHVWTTAANQQPMTAALAAGGVRVLAETDSSTLVSRFRRQGPGLVSGIYLIESLTAAVLAAGSVAAALLLSARRRRYEYAALAVSGEGPRSLFAGAFFEQAISLLFGGAAGVAAGLIAAKLVLPSVPEFAVAPASVPLSFTPALAPMAVAVALALGLLLITAALSSRVMVSRLRVDQLREVEQ